MAAMNPPPEDGPLTSTQSSLHQEEQFESLVGISFTDAYQYAFRCARRKLPPWDAEDLAHQALAKILDKINQKRLQPVTSNPKGWLNTVVKNQYAEDIRRKITIKRSSPGREVSLDSEDVAEPASRTPGPEESALTSDQSEMIYRHMEKIPRRQQEVVVMVSHGMTFREIAEKLDRSSNTVKTQYYAAIEKLRNAIRPDSH
ncbi:sigma-70 family RNA polymerase sigma factor [Streptomyces sp. NPDC005571]|uniref:RNA polymerase sigma factor n=1 Tax=Streptomyces sp. NPDC005571 TaxID=3156888 RepID=UPI0033A530DC